MGPERAASPLQGAPDCGDAAHLLSRQHQAQLHKWAPRSLPPLSGLPPSWGANLEQPDPPRSPKRPVLCPVASKAQVLCKLEPQVPQGCPTCSLGASALDPPTVPTHGAAGRREACFSVPGTAGPHADRENKDRTDPTPLLAILLRFCAQRSPHRQTLRVKNRRHHQRRVCAVGVGRVGGMHDPRQGRCWPDAAVGSRRLRPTWGPPAHAPVVLTWLAGGVQRASLEAPVHTCPQYLAKPISHQQGWGTRATPGGPARGWGLEPRGAWGRGQCWPNFIWKAPCRSGPASARAARGTRSCGFQRQLCTLGTGQGRGQAAGDGRRPPRHSPCVSCIKLGALGVGAAKPHAS